jgi:leucyl aminopeptidase
MKFTPRSGHPKSLRSGCAVVAVHEPRSLSAAASELDQAAGGQITRLLRRGDASGKPGKTMMLHGVPGISAERVLLVGCGPKGAVSEGNYRKALTAMTEALEGSGARDAVCHLTALKVDGRDLAWRVRTAVECVAGARYRFDQLKSGNDQAKPKLTALGLAVDSRREFAAAERAIAIGAAVAAGVHLARDLGNLPGNVCTPTHLAAAAQALKKGRRNVKVSVLEQADMEQLGMGALLSVARGSREPPKLIAVEYRGAGKEEAPHVLVGKGITFDSGGISIKPAAAMDEMKFDMCGAASVLGALHACIELKLPLNVVGLVPSCENLPDGAANKPGDIVTSLSGQTVEVLNTDAEGRLILCDALTYAERYAPQSVIDIATLTGACVIALGNQAAGLLGNDRKLVGQLLAAGESSGDRAWELPLWEEYQEQLKSNFADMANIGGREAGTITAACFLARFTKKLRWAHLDIAGVAWRGGHHKGATGRPVPLLVQYLLDRAGN